MVSIGFKEQFAPLVESGEKRQTIRQAKCTNKRCPYGQDKRQLYKYCHIKLEDSGFCQMYEHRIKAGDTLQLYTGLRQRKYCKVFPDVPASCKALKVKLNKDRSCDFGREKILGKVCNKLGAKLLKETPCTESFPIKFEDLTEEHARLDGFKHEIIPCDCDLASKPHLTELTRLQQLKDFLFEQYGMKPGDIVQVIRWK